MSKFNLVEKKRVYIECTDANRKVKALILNKNDKIIKVKLPTGAIMELEKKYCFSIYKLQLGMLEFICDGKLVT